MAIDTEWKKMMQTNVSDFISTVDFKNPDFSVKEFKGELKKILGMEPSVKLKWNTQEKVNELLKDSGAPNHTTIVEKVEQVNITIVDAENKNAIEFKFII